MTDVTDSTRHSDTLLKRFQMLINCPDEHLVMRKVDMGEQALCFAMLELALYDLKPTNKRRKSINAKDQESAKEYLLSTENSIFGVEWLCSYLFTEPEMVLNQIRKTVRRLTHTGVRKPTNA